MAQEIILHARTNGKLLSIPPEIESLLALVSGRQRLDPSHISLTRSQQDFLKAKTRQLEFALKQNPEPEKNLDIILEFIRAVSHTNYSKEQITAKGTAFMVALADYPVWVITEAMVRWHRGEVSDKINTSFPNSQALRSVCELVRSAAEGKIIVFNRLLEYSQLPDHDEKYKETMLQKIKELFSFAIKTA